MATPMRSTDFRRIVEPIMNEEFDGVYDQRKDEWKKLFKTKKSLGRSYDEEAVLFGFGNAPELPDGSPVTYDAGGTHYFVRYVPKVYGMAFAVTQVLVEDGDHIKIGQTYSRHLAQSLIETKETNAANIFNRAFNSSYLGGDGVCLASASHPLAVGGTWSNLLTTSAALSQTSLEQMLIQIRQVTDARGKKMRLEGQRLVVHPTNMFQAEVILKSALRTGTANNDINVLKDILPNGYEVLSRLTSSTAWYIQTDVQDGLKYLERRKLTKSMEGDFETDSMRYKATERYSFGWTDPRGMFATPGT